MGLWILLSIISRCKTRKRMDTRATGAKEKKKKEMCALWFHQTVKGRLPIYGKYRNITPYPCSLKSTDTKVPVKRINTKVDSALPLYNTPCHPADSESKKILGLVSIPFIERDAFAPST